MYLKYFTNINILVLLSVLKVRNNYHWFKDGEIRKA